MFDGGGGGGGGAGAVLSGSGSVVSPGNVTGGAGGNGGKAGSGGGGGGGGGGGSGLVDTGINVTNAFAITGGNGGTGTNNTVGNRGANGGNGGAGVRGSSFALTNSGVIQGGAGGAKGAGINSYTQVNGVGGEGVIGSNLQIVNSGAIAGGLAGDGVTRASAIAFTGGVNSLEIWSTSNITGNVVAFSSSDTFRLGGAANQSFDVSQIGPAAQYRGFGHFEKVGASTWTLTNTTTAATSWNINQGILSISSDGNLGSTGGGLTLNGGTLQGTATFSSSARPITITSSNGGIDVTAANTLTWNGVLSGSGALTKTGAGALVLTASNSYMGGTVLNAGTLQISADANLGDAAGTLIFNGGTLENTASFSSSRAVTVNSGGGAFQTDADLTMSGVISGSGALTKTGAATLVLTGNDSYSGGTTISTGIVQIGNGGTGGVIVGDVADNGALVLDRSDAASLAGVISGSGTVSQIGTGTTTLTGTNTYAGGTSITAGTLVGSAASFGSGAILDNAALVINQPVDGAMANVLNGSGSLTKQGSGRLNYTGAGTLSGPTTVSQGLLSVNGSLAFSAVTVQSGASLGGNGTVGATTIQSGGTIAPGNSIGTLHINGAFVQNAGSVYQVEVDPNTNASDLIAVNGTAKLESGAGLNVIKYVAGNYQVGTVYKVLTASGGLSGTYSLSGQTMGVSAFLGLKDSYDANNAYLTVVQTRPLTDVATTPNQQQVAQAVDALPPPAPVVTAVVNVPDAPAARAAFDQLSGQVQASAQGALLANGLYVRDVAFDRLRDVVCVPAEARDRCDGRKRSIWGQGFGGWGGIAGNGNATGLNHSAAGFLVGVDVPVQDFRLGFFGGYSHADFNIVSGEASGDSNDYHLGVYGGTLLEGVAIRLGASYSWDGVTTDRAVQIGSFNDALHGVYNAGTIQAFGEVGRRLEMDGFALEPFANLAYLSLHTTGFTEAGGPAALTVKAGGIDNVITTVGLRPSMDLVLGGVEATLRGMAGWRHTAGAITPTSLVSFAGGNPFSVSGASLARDAAAVEAGLDVTLGEGMSLGLTYGGQFSARTTDQMARGTIRIRF